MSKFFNETTRGRNVFYPEEKALPIERKTSPEEKIDLISRQTTTEIAPSSGDIPVDAKEPSKDSFRQIEIPSASRLRGLFQGSDWLDSAEESYRALRTRLLRMRAARDLRSAILTSAIQGEGKTLTSLNLALCCSQLPELRVLLIDSDLRTAGLTRLLGFPSGPGLANVLSGLCEPRDAILATDYPNLYVLPAGQSDKPAAELLAGKEWHQLISDSLNSFDLILIDAPPVLNLADVELLAAECDGILLVVRAGFVRRDVLEKSVKQFDPKRLLGLIYNGAEGKAYPRYYYGYGTPKN